MMFMESVHLNEQLFGAMLLGYLVFSPLHIFYDTFEGLGRAFSPSVPPAQLKFLFVHCLAPLSIKYGGH